MAPGARVAYLGPPASYSHQAALEDFPTGVELEAQISIQDVFVAVQAGDCSYGVVPFENSTYGSVVYTLDLLSDRQNQYPDLAVCGEIYLDIRHYLLGHRSQDKNQDPKRPSISTSGATTPTEAAPNPQQPRVKPIADISHVQRIYSHYQAFGQCKAFLSSYLNGIERQEVSSTSKGAEVVAGDSSRTSASISGKTAAQVHGLDVLAECIQDRDDNTTRFFVLRRATESPLPPLPFSMRDNQDTHEDQRAWKTLAAFTINHTEAGALAEALLVFKSFGLNLTSINSRPSQRRPWHYIFMVEFEGRQREDGAGSVVQALKRLEAITEECRWHGSWQLQGEKVE